MPRKEFELLSDAGKVLRFSHLVRSRDRFILSPLALHNIRHLFLAQIAEEADHILPAFNNGQASNDDRSKEGPYEYHNDPAGEKAS